MTVEETRAYLESHWRLTLGSIGPDGFPHLAPMNYLYRDGAFLMTTFRKSQKVVNFVRNPHATLLVETGSTYDELRSVMAYADAEIVDDPAFAYEVLTAMPGGPAMGLSADARSSAQASAAKRVVLRLHPHKYISWDHTKLAGRY